MKCLVLIIFTLMQGNYALCSGAHRYKAINWTLATKRGSLSNEREYKYLGYENNTTDHCDLTEDYCDIHCCGDKDCTSEEKSSFHCQEKEINNILPFCSTENEWANFLSCGMMNTPYLGNFYVNEKKIQKRYLFQRATNMRKRKYFKYSSIAKKQDTSDAEEYRFGVPVKTIKHISAEEALVVVNNLHLPSNIKLALDDVCLGSTPIRYLVPHNSVCIRQISPKTCGLNLPLHLAQYLLIDSFYNISGTHDFPKISYDNSNYNFTSVKVKLVCVKTSDYTTNFINPYNTTTAEIDNVDFLEDCGDLESISETRYNNDLNVCHNVVTQVNYNFYWNGSTIVGLEATYVLVDVPVTGSGTISLPGPLRSVHFKKSINRIHTQKNDFVYIKQYFNVRFIHQPNNSAEENNGTTGVFSPVIRSRNSGYNVGSHIFVVSAIAPDVNSSHLNYKEDVLNTWASGSDCERLQPVTFGFDSASSCVLWLVADDFADCEELRRRVASLHSALLPGAWLASGSEHANYSARPELLVPLLRDEAGVGEQEPVANGTELGLGAGAAGCGGVPSGRRLQLLLSARSIVGARLSVQQEWWSAPPPAAARPRPFRLSAAVEFARRRPASPPLSRFWARELGPDGSETAWRHALRALERPLEPEETADLLALTAAALAVMLVALWPARRPPPAAG